MSRLLGGGSREGCLLVVRGGFDAMDKKRTVVSFVTAQVRFFVRACWM